jgi:hypothetical protein
VVIREVGRGWQVLRLSLRRHAVAFGTRLSERPLARETGIVVRRSEVETMPGQRASIAILIAAITAATPAAAQPEYAPPQPEDAPSPPPGARVDFVSSGGIQWEVLVDRQPACATPCSLWLDPARWVTMRTRERRPLRLEVGRVGHGETMVIAKPLSTGAYATGVTFTTLGGAALVTGITLGAVGCSTDNRGMCTAGWITGGAGLVVTAGAIWLIQRSLPRLRIAPAAYASGAAVGARF